MKNIDHLVTRLQETRPDPAPVKLFRMPLPFRSHHHTPPLLDNNTPSLSLNYLSRKRRELQITRSPLCNRSRICRSFRNISDILHVQAQSLSNGLTHCPDRDAVRHYAEYVVKYPSGYLAVLSPKFPLFRGFGEYPQTLPLCFPLESESDQGLEYY